MVSLQTLCFSVVYACINVDVLLASTSTLIIGLKYNFRQNLKTNIIFKACLLIDLYYITAGVHTLKY